MHILERLLALIAPHACLGCQQEGSLLCYGCQMRLPPVVPHCYRCGRTDKGNRTCKACTGSSALYSVTAATSYEDVAKVLVRAVKYERKQAGAKAMAEALDHHLNITDIRTCVITHAPTASQRIRVRGYDQAELVAKELARQLRLPYLPLLQRTQTRRQVGQTRVVRAQQMVGAFRPINASRLKNRHILLIDDVITTGSTLESAALTLRQAGAKRVSAAVFAAA